MAGYVLRDVLARSQEPIHRLNTLAVMGNISYRNERFAEAITHYDDFFRQHDRNMPVDEFVIPPAEVAKELIISLFSTNNRPRAESTQRNLSNVLGRDNAILTEIRLHEGIYYARMDRGRAVRPLTAVIDDLNTPAEMAFRAMYWRGVVHTQDRRIEQAINDFTAAMNSTDEMLSNQAALSLGNVHLNQGNHIQAMEYYYLVILNDNDGRFARDAAHNFALAGKHVHAWEQVIAAYQIIMDRWGQAHLSNETMVTIGFSYFQAGEHTQALNILNHLINSGELRDVELQAEAHYWVGEALSAQRNFAEAQATYRLIRSSFSRATRWADLAHLRIGEMYLQQGETERGMTVFRELVRIHGAGSDIGREANRYLQ
jgi:tetratricopeptide (TPR) repeat protein